MGASKLALALLTVCALAACNPQRGQRLEDIPTLASFDALQQAATAQIMTQNAPPPGFRESVSFAEVDDRLTELPGWRYIVTLGFDGAFAADGQPTSATARAEVWFNQLGAARRVLVEATGELIGAEDDMAFEAVRLGPDAFLVRGNTCLSGGPDAASAADLRAGRLVGGVLKAVPTGRRATLNGLEAWEYTFSAQDLNLPSVRLEPGGRISAASGELWVAPAHNAVVRFYVNLNAENAIIFDRELPVSGQVILRYDLYDVGTAANIAVPFGC
ncbi:MAG: hypothetical protein ACUVSX_15815 [Aggregatilineales bacterium]